MRLTCRPHVSLASFACADNRLGAKGGFAGPGLPLLFGIRGGVGCSAPLARRGGVVPARVRRAGFRGEGFDVFGWVRNAFDVNYIENLQVAPGNTGLIAGQVGDPQTWGGTIKFSF